MASAGFGMLYWTHSKMMHKCLANGMALTHLNCISFAESQASQLGTISKAQGWEIRPVHLSQVPVVPS